MHVGRISLGSHRACRYGEPAHRYLIQIRTLYRKQLSGHRYAVGYELLDTPDRPQWRRMAIHLHSRQDTGLQADSPAESLDERLWHVLPDAHHGRSHLRPGEACKLVLAQGRSGKALLLPRLSGRLRHHRRDSTHRASCHVPLYLPPGRHVVCHPRRIRSRFVCAGAARQAPHRGLHNAQQRRCNQRIQELVCDRFR